MRKSLQDIAHMVKDIPYCGELPSELKPYRVYLLDSGHCIMCVLKTHLSEAKQSSMDDYELPIPVKYVIEKGYTFMDDYVIVDAEYDSIFGLVVDSIYNEF